MYKSDRSSVKYNNKKKYDHGYKSQTFVYMCFLKLILILPSCVHICSPSTAKNYKAFAHMACNMIMFMISVLMHY